MSISSVKREVSKDRSWVTWVGSLADVERLWRLLETLASSRRALLLEALGSPPGGDESVDGPYRRREFEREKSSAIEQTTPKVVIEADGETVRGSYQDVIKELDLRTYSRLKLVLDHYNQNDKIRITFIPARGFAAGGSVFLHVESTDPGWAAQALSQISNELDKGKPRWSWWHGTVGAGASYLVIYLSVGVTLASVAHIWLGWSFSAAVASIAAALIGLKTSRSLLRWALPPVEIHAEGVQPRASRAISFFLGVVLVPILISLLLALIL